MHNEAKYDLIISKSANIVSKLVPNQHLPIIKSKTPEKAWKALQERF